MDRCQAPGDILVPIAHDTELVLLIRELTAITPIMKMKSLMKLKFILPLIATSLLSSSGLFGATLADWTFESLNLSTAYTNNPADGKCNNVIAETGSGTASGVHASAAAVYSTPAGNGSSKSFNANTWTVGD